MTPGWAMGGLTPLVWTMLVAGTDYPFSLLSGAAAFVLFGGSGVAWCAVFALWFRDRPEHDPGGERRRARC